MYTVSTFLAPVSNPASMPALPPTVMLALSDRKYKGALDWAGFTVERLMSASKSLQEQLRQDTGTSTIYLDGCLPLLNLVFMRWCYFNHSSFRKLPSEATTFWSNLSIQQIKHMEDQTLFHRCTHLMKFPASEQHPIHTNTTGTATSKMNEQTGDTADNIPFNQIRNSVAGNNQMNAAELFSATSVMQHPRPSGNAVTQLLRAEKTPVHYSKQNTETPSSQHYIRAFQIQFDVTPPTAQQPEGRLTNGDQLNVDQLMTPSPQPMDAAKYDTTPSPQIKSASKRSRTDIQ